MGNRTLFIVLSLIFFILLLLYFVYPGGYTGPDTPFIHNP